jgi:nicotinate-nucleotide adenylyltransferase
MRIGILGGTFDPVHIGHLIMADEAIAQLSLAEVLFVPAGDPWRKSDERRITPAEHRLAMLQIAVAGDDRFGISDIEVRREGPSYTADTLAALAAERLDDELVFLLGADAFADLPHWHEPHRIVGHAMLAVAPRATADLRDLLARVTGISLDRVLKFEMPRVDVSSTDVRERIARGRPVRYLLPPGVASYIDEHGLYR